MDAIMRGIRGIRAAGVCPTHGDFDAFALPDHVPKCPACLREELAAEAREDSRRIAREALSANLAAAGIPSRYVGAELGHFPMDVAGRVAGWAQMAAQNEAVHLLITGGVGTGKTHLAAALSGWLAGRGVRTCYATAGAYLRALRDTWGAKDKREGDVFRRYASAPVLVLDDIGASADNHNDVWRLHELIDERYSAALPTAFVSNLPTKALREYLGDRAYDRLRERVVGVMLGGTSLRSPLASPSQTDAQSGILKKPAKGIEG